MSSVLIVLPILSLLMFDLGLGLAPADFARVLRAPRAVLAGMLGQIVLLPGLVWLLCSFLGVEDSIYVGMMLIACCPGGSSSNVFTSIARGEVALSVTLTACSSLITLVTMPLILGAVVKLPVGNLVLQNLVLVLLPVVIGMTVRRKRPEFSEKCHKLLRRLAFPLLMLLAAVFFVDNREVIIANFAQLGMLVTAVILLAMGGGWFLGWLAQLNSRVRRTLVIEVGMQNAAQAIVLAGSPLVFNDASMAVPAIVYALMMNVVLLVYVGIVSQWKS